MNYSEQVNDIISNANLYHEEYYDEATFYGPSLHFHLKALEYLNSKDKERYLEYIYAALTSWGMHRMGPTGAKMRDFGEFKKSVVSVDPLISELRGKSLPNFDIDDWNKLEKVFKNIKIMKSSINIIGNSKVLAHLLPNIFSPIDRQYTLNFLRGSKYIRSGDLDYEWNMAKDIHQNFFLPLLESRQLNEQLEKWTKNDEFQWDTSNMKILDNLLIGAAKN